MLSVFWQKSDGLLFYALNKHKRVHLGLTSCRETDGTEVSLGAIRKTVVLKRCSADEVTAALAGNRNDAGGSRYGVRKTGWPGMFYTWSVGILNWWASPPFYTERVWVKRQ